MRHLTGECPAVSVLAVRRERQFLTAQFDEYQILDRQGRLWRLAPGRVLRELF
jgi:hypothetical protein